MAVNLGKPGTVGATDNPTQASSGIGSHSNANYTFKLWAMDSDTYSPTVETTGDGDATPRFENNDLLYMNVALRGAMIDSQAIGLQNLINSSGNAGDATATGNTQLVKLEVLLTGARKVVIKMAVERIRIGWRRRAQFVAVTIQGKMSDTAISGIEASV